ncbi:MAG TPA: hypothetical protein PK340_02160 [Bacilli bacterium]|nr:hypothetical protein [Bacilli bacterium]
MNKHIKSLAFLALTLALASGCASSSSQFDYASVAGIYDLESAYLDEYDITSDYSLYQITLRDDQTMNVFVSQLGQITNRDGTYTIVGSTLTETSNSQTYVYAYDFEDSKITYAADEFGQDLVITLIKRIVIDGPVPVEFESVLFGEDIDATKKFNYAPTVIREMEDGKDVIHIWYCTNKTTAIIMDHIAYRRGEKQDDGKWIFSDELIVIAPTIDTWDGRHACDPSVIKGRFVWESEVYNYMMAYLGCVTDDYSNNETGLAVAKAPEGPWIKLDHLNPIVPWSRDNVSGTWGNGMPSLLSVDRQGVVLLYYMNASIGVSVEKWDFSNLDDPTQIYRSRLINNGLKRPNNTQNYISYVEIAYDEALGRLYVLSGGGVKDPPDGTRTLVNSHFALAYIDGMDDFDDIDAAMLGMNYTWTMVGFGGPDETGWPRNHNSALVTDSYGRIIDSDEIWVVTSTGLNTYPFDNIYTYRLRGYIFHL